MENSNKNKGPNKIRQGWGIILFTTLLVTFVVMGLYSMMQGGSASEISYDKFLKLVDNGKVESVTFTNSRINIVLTDDARKEKAEGKLTELDPQYLSNYYGIDTADLDEYVFAQSDTPESSAETIIIIKSADTSKFDSYKTSFENYKKQKSQELTNYNLPDQAKLVDKSKVVEKGNYLYLVISKNADEIIATIEKNI